MNSPINTYNNVFYNDFHINIYKLNEINIFEHFKITN